MIVLTPGDGEEETGLAVKVIEFFLLVIEYFNFSETFYFIYVRKKRNSYD